MRLRTILNIIVMLLVIPLFAFTTVFYFTTESEMMDNFTNSAHDFTRHAADEFVKRMKSAESTFETLSLLPIFKNRTTDQINIAEIQSELNPIFTEYSGLFEQLIFIGEQGNPVYSIEKFYDIAGSKVVFVNTETFVENDSAYLFAAKLNNGQLVKSRYFLGETGYVIRFLITLENFCTVAADVKIDGLCEGILDTENSIADVIPRIILSNGTIVFSQINNEVSRQIENIITGQSFDGIMSENLKKSAEEHHVFSDYSLIIPKEIDGTGLKLIYSADLSRYFLPIRNGVLFNLGIGAVLLILMLVISGWISNRLLFSMRTLVDGANSIAAGDFKKKISLGNYYELQQLADDFNSVGETLEKNIAKINRINLELLERAKVEEISELKSQFISHVSHEMMSPLTSINWTIENMLSGVGGSISPKQKEYLLKLRETANHLSRVFNDLLDISRIEAGKIQLVKTQFDLRRAVNEAVYICLRGIEEKHLAVSVCEAQQMIVLADETRLVEIFRNIIENAVNYSTQNGKIEIKFETKKNKTGSSYVVSVKDEGPGVPKEIEEKIFDRFYKGKSKKGIGLGLAIASDLAKLNGGSISLNSEYTHGAEFVIQLPAQISNNIGSENEKH